MSINTRIVSRKICFSSCSTVVTCMYFLVVSYLLVLEFLIHNNLLLTDCEGRNGEYSGGRLWQYSPVWLKQTRLVYKVVYNVALILAANFVAFKNKKFTACDHFHGNGPYGEIPTKKEPITVLGFTSRMHCVIIIKLTNKTKSWKVPEKSYFLFFIYF